MASLECYDPNGWYLKHTNNLTQALPVENSESFRLASSWILEEGLFKTELEDGANTISFRSLDRKDHYLQIINGNTLVLNKIDLNNKNATFLATFIIRKGLVQSNLYSFEVLSQPGFYFRYQVGNVVAEKLQGDNY